MKVLFYHWVSLNHESSKVLFRHYDNWICLSVHNTSGPFHVFLKQVLVCLAVCIKLGRFKSPFSHLFVLVSHASASWGQANWYSVRTSVRMGWDAYRMPQRGKIPCYCRFDSFLTNWLRRTTVMSCRCVASSPKAYTRLSDSSVDSISR